jgi:hypothetical protein
VGYNNYDGSASRLAGIDCLNNNKSGIRLGRLIMTGSKWDITINKIEGKPSKFGKSGAHICLPQAWLRKTIVVVTKETWEELQK